MQIVPELLILRRAPVENHLSEVSPVDTKPFVLALIFTEIHDWCIKQWQRIEQVIVNLFIFKMNTFAVTLLHRLMHHFGFPWALRFNISNNELVSNQWANPLPALKAFSIIHKLLHMKVFVGAA